MYLLSVDHLDEIGRRLRGRGVKTIGPVVRDGVITHDEFDSVREFPTGWTEEQDGGRYRLQPTGTDELFAYSSPSTSWKRYLYPERTLLITARRADGRTEVVLPAVDATPMAFFGIRSCDLAALAILDRVFLDPDATDPSYAARRPGTFIVAAACNHPGGTCFCVSMDTGPTPSVGFDLSIREIWTDDRHQFLAEIGSDAGAAILAEVDAQEATEDDVLLGERAHQDASAAMGRRLRSDDPPRAAASPDHPQWDDIAARCLACGNCTMACPTCFCSATEDSTDLSGTEAERWRVWDSCFTIDFSHLHGGAARSGIKARYRQWLLHKLVTWHDQFGSSGCVGCGRCITWCPVGIDLTAEIEVLARPPLAGSTAEATTEARPS